MKSLIATYADDRIYAFLNEYTFGDEDLLKTCLTEIEDKLEVNPKVKVFGKDAVQHRSVGFFSDSSIGYYYSGQLARSKPLTNGLKQLLSEINNIFGEDFNGILINRYENGCDYIGAHSDDERYISDSGVVALSFGAERIFRIREKVSKKKILDIQMKSGQILQMGGRFQKQFTHEVPVQKRIKDPRVSFTFRKHNL